MIKATEAQANVLNYEFAIRVEVRDKVNELINVMSKSIEFHSKNGLTGTQFCPYDKSRFSTIKALEYAQELFQTIFEDAGYIVIENSYEKNSLKIKW